MPYADVEMNRFLIALTSFAIAGFLSAQEPIPPREVKPEDKKAAPAKEPAKAEPKEELDVQKTAERIAENAQKAGERLKEKDPGVDTRKIQQEILKDIDALLKKAQEPPPPSPPMSSEMPPPMMPPPKDGMSPPKDGMAPKSPMPMGGPSGMPPPKGSSGSQGNEGKKPRRERKPRGDSPMGMSEPMANASPKGMNPMPEKKEPNGDPKGGTEKKDGKEGDQFGKKSPKRENDKLADLYKDVWGHLPERLRQEMDLYYREQFMPRYSELLKQYYSSLAEQRKKSGDGK